MAITVEEPSADDLNVVGAVVTEGEVKEAAEEADEAEQVPVEEAGRRGWRGLFCGEDTCSSTVRDLSPSLTVTVSRSVLSVGLTKVKAGSSDSISVSHTAPFMLRSMASSEFLARSCSITNSFCSVISLTMYAYRGSPEVLSGRGNTVQRPQIVRPEWPAMKSKCWGMPVDLLVCM